MITVNDKVLSLVSASSVLQQQFEQGASTHVFTSAVDQQVERLLKLLWRKRLHQIDTTLQARVGGLKQAKISGFSCVEMK